MHFFMCSIFSFSFLRFDFFFFHFFTFFIFTIFFFHFIFFPFFVCGSMFKNGRTRTHVSSSVQCSSRAAARGLALCPRYHPAWVSVGSLVGPGKGHPRHTGARSAGRPWVTHEIRQHSTQRRNTPNMVATAQYTVQEHPKHGSGATSIQGKSVECCKTVHEDHDHQCRNVDDFRVHTCGTRGTCVDSVQCERSYS